MPLYTMIIKGDGELEIPETYDFPDLHAALDEAREAGRELLADGARDGEDRRHWSIMIRDGTGRVVSSVSLADTVSRTDLSSHRALK